MRVDEDVCVTRLPPVDLSAALAADYAYALETVESHLEATVDTFQPWVRAYLETTDRVPTLPPLPIQMFRLEFSDSAC